MFDYDALFDFCRGDGDEWNEVQKLLNKSTELVDIFHDNNLYLTIAVKHNNIEIIKTLINYYEEKYINEEGISEYEVQNRKNLLKDAITDAVDSTGKATKETLAILEEYIIKPEKAESVTGLEDEPDPVFDDTESDAAERRDSTEVDKLSAKTHEEDVTYSHSLMGSSSDEESAA